jgi:NAD(P)-dependent dehydrogenase (short-subunit alcohol dehydrogenase family)
MAGSAATIRYADRMVDPTVDRVVAIAGATGGAGRAAAAAFARAGTRLGLIGTDEGRLAALAGELGLELGRWHPGVANLRSGDEARKAVAAIESALGPVGVLLNLVGGWSGGTPAVEMSADDIDEMLGQHLYGTLNMIQATVPGMLERGWGRVIALSTPLAAEPGPRGGGYVVAKAAQEALMRTLARDTAGTGVTANLIIVRNIDVKHERESDPTPKNASWTTPEEIAEVMVMLAGDAASTINGARIPLYGR